MLKNTFTAIPLRNSEEWRKFKEFLTVVLEGMARSECELERYFQWPLWLCKVPSSNSKFQNGGKLMPEFFIFVPSKTEYQ